MIISVSDPKWDKNTNEWVIIYTVKDITAGTYNQKVKTENLVSADRMHALILEAMAKQKGR